MSAYDIDTGSSAAVDCLKYAGFWPRLGALLLDGLIMFPLGVFVFWGGLHHRLFQVYYAVPGILFSLFYNVYLVRRYGGTPGKRIAGLRIRKLDESEIGYREAFLRQLPDLIFDIVTTAGNVYACLVVTDSQYSSMTFLDRGILASTLPPTWLWSFFSISQTVWSWSELVVMMTNRKRRALHDFIAGTVVVIDLP